MQGADGKYGPVTDKVSWVCSGSMWKYMQDFENSLSHSEAETVINFICAVKAVSFTQGALWKQTKNGAVNIWTILVCS